jgi:protein-disulfide isomerase-like protein with CxxC motif
MNTKTKRIGIVATLVALAALAIAGAVVFAQASNSASGSDAATTTFLAKVAKNLGISEATLVSAMQTANEQSIDEALAAGRITAEQAAAMKERLAAKKAMDLLIADGVASGKITQAQADLRGGPSSGGRRMVGRGPMGSRGGQGPESGCGEGMMSGRGGR